jgi:hypothetical protein
MVKIVILPSKPLAEKDQAVIGFALRSNKFLLRRCFPLTLLFAGYDLLSWLASFFSRWACRPRRRGARPSMAL